MAQGQPVGLLLSITDGTPPPTVGNPVGLLLALTDGSGVSSLPTGTYQLVGNGANLVLNTILTASPANLTLTGNPALFNVTEPEAVAPYTLTPTSTGLSVSLVCSTGTFTLTGKDAVLTPAGSTIMTAAPGAFTLTGVPAIFNAGVVAAQQTYTLTGVNAALDRGMPAVTAAYTLTGVGTTKFNAAQLETPGAFSLIGGLTLLTPALAGATRSYVLTGISAAFSTVYKANVTPYVLTGIAASLNPTGQPSKPYVYGVIF